MSRYKAPVWASGLSLLLFFSALPAAAAAAEAGNCTITVVSVRKSGEKSEQVFRVPAKDKADCEQKAAAYRTNFSPQTIERKSVKAELGETKPVEAR